MLACYIDERNCINTIIEQYFLLLDKLLPDSVMASSRSEENVVLNNFQHKDVAVLVYPNDFIWVH